MSMLVSGGLAVVGGAVGFFGAGSRKRAAAREKARREAEIKQLVASRQEVSNPYASTTDLSGLAKDLSGMMTNPFASMGVATNAAKMEIEEADLALASTLDTLKATGAGAGGATALAQAALKSKQGVAASIETQEVANEKARAQGEMRMNEQKISEQQRLQGIQISEGQRTQQADAQGNIFEYNANEARSVADINRAAGLADRAAAQEAQAGADQTGAITGMLGGIASAYTGFKTK